MSRTISTTVAVAATALVMTSTTSPSGVASAFVVAPVTRCSSSNIVTAPSASKAASAQTSTQLYGLFDGVKDAFVAPALEQSTIDAERETPIDRWMGWTVKSENQNTPNEMPVEFVDAMDAVNYVAVELEKPMGVVFEENDEEFGGIFIESMKEGGVAAENGVLQVGDQLVGVGLEKVSGLSFEDALGKIIDSETEKTKLLVFRGTAKQLYGPTGASKEWIDEFVAGGGVAATAPESS